MMTDFDIGKYTYYVDREVDFHKMSPIIPVPAGLLDSIRSYDHMLHQSIDEIFCERGLSSNGQIQEFIRGPQLKSLIEPILEQEPILSKHFSKEEFGKFSLLWIAVFVGYEKSAELLVRSGADVNELFGRHHPPVIDEKSTVLHILIQMDFSPENERLIRLVVDHGADLQARDSQGQTVLHRAVEKERVQTTEMLLEKGADVNAAGDGGWIPLLYAACSINKSNELVPLLMKHGADVFFKPRDNQNALHCLPCSSANTVDVARVLIEKGVSIDDEDNIDHCQPIHFAAMFGRNELIKLYLDHGANVNALTNEGKSPLHYAAYAAGITVVETLLERGANIHLKTTKDRTALHAVCKRMWRLSSPSLEELNNCKSIIKRLLSAGADLLAEDRNGRTPLVTRIRGLRNGRQPGQESWPLIEALALKKALQPSIELMKDEMIIERYQKLRDYYRKCTDEIDRMKSTRFIDSCSFFELFAKSQRQIVALMRNPDFETKFRLYDLNDEFSIYAQDLRQAFERTLKHHHSLLEQENVINEAVYYILPDLVVRKVVHYIELLQEC